VSMARKNKKHSTAVRSKSGILASSHH
jgi:hypothetical protein